MAYAERVRRRLSWSLVLLVAIAIAAALIVAQSRRTPITVADLGRAVSWRLQAPVEPGVRPPAARPRTTSRIETR